MARCELHGGQNLNDSGVCSICQAQEIEAIQSQLSPTLEDLMSIKEEDVWSDPWPAIRRKLDPMYVGIGPVR